jgi:hypothetical protein
MTKALELPSSYYFEQNTSLHFRSSSFLDFISRITGFAFSRSLIYVAHYLL